MNNNVTDLLNEEEIKTDIMRYKNNGTSFWLSILAIIADVVMFVIIYKQKECVPDFQMGFDLLINVIYMLAVFLIAEKTKAYNKNASYAAFIVAAIQIARIFWIPLNYLNNGLTVVQFGWCVGLIVLSAISLVAAGIVAIVKNNKLEAHLQMLEEMR
jgi:hypothetical protein